MMGLIEKLREHMAGIAPAMDWSSHMPMCPQLDKPCEKDCDHTLVDHGYVMHCQMQGDHMPAAPTTVGESAAPGSDEPAEEPQAS